MKPIKIIFFIAFCLPVIASAQKKAIISIENNSLLNRNNTVIEVSWETLVKQFQNIDTANFIVINTATKQQVPYQLEHKGHASIQNLLVQVNVKAKSTLTLTVQKGKPQVFPSKTYARYVPERLDDFAWENDKIAFRMYGKALESTNENAYGLDVWVKRTDKLVINERYKSNKYHIDRGDGMDYYHVGFSLGAGNMAPYINDTIRYSANYHQWKVLDNGPLRSTFQLIYDEWNAGGIKVKAVKTITLDAGTQLNRIENVYTFNNVEKLPVVAGIIKRPTAGTILLKEQSGIMAYWEPEHDKDGITGVGTILTTPISNMMVTKAQILSKTEAQNNQALVYYTGACWNKAGEITTDKQWSKYLDDFNNRLKEPLKITVQ